MAEAMLQGLLGKTPLLFHRECKLVGSKDKLEPRAIGLSQRRLLVVQRKSPPKVETSLHVLDIVSVQTPADNELVIETSSTTLVFRECADSAQFVTVLHGELSKAFPSVPFSCFVRTKKKLLDMPPTRKLGPCGDFIFQYRYACDYYGVQPRVCGVEDVIVSLSEIRSTTFDAEAFGLFEASDAAALVTALHFNTWFTKLQIRNVRLRSDVLDALVMLFRRTSVLEEVELHNVGAKADFFSLVAQSIRGNPAFSIHGMDLSSNNIEDKGAISLAPAFKNIPRGMTSLEIDSCNLGARGTQAIAKALKANVQTKSTLKRLSIANNPCGQDGAAAAVELLSESNILTDLNIAAVGCVLESVFQSLATSVCGSLTRLNLANNKFTVKKQFRPPPTLMQFVQTAGCLKALDLTGTKITFEAVTALMSSLGLNPLLTGVEVRLAACELTDIVLNTLGASLAQMPSIGSLDISDNDFTDEAVAQFVTKLRDNASLRKLTLNKTLVKSKSTDRTIRALAEMTVNNHSGISELSLADCKFKADMVPFLQALSRNNTLKTVNVSGNLFGDVGCEFLASSLHYNKVLSSLAWDDNQVSLLGLRVVANALRVNTGLRHLALPLSDMTAIMRTAPEDVAKAVDSIQQSLCANHSPGRFAHVTATLPTAGVSQRELETLVDQVNRSAKDAATRGQATEAAVKSSQLLKRISSLEGDKRSDLNNRLLEKLNTFSSSLAAFIAEDLSASADEMLATLVTLTGYDPEHVPQPAPAQYEALIQQLCARAVVDGAGPHVIRNSAEQLLSSAHRTTDFCLQQSVNLVRNLLSPGSAPKPLMAPPPPPKPEPVKMPAAVPTAKAAAAARAQANKPAEEIKFDLGSDGDGGVKLVHHTKSRPKAGGRRPPTRPGRSRAAGGASSSASTSASTSASASATPSKDKTTPKPSPRPRTKSNAADGSAKKKPGFLNKMMRSTSGRLMGGDSSTDEPTPAASKEAAKPGTPQPEKAPSSPTPSPRPKPATRPAPQARTALLPDAAALNKSKAFTEKQAAAAAADAAKIKAQPPAPPKKTKPLPPPPSRKPPVSKPPVLAAAEPEKEQAEVEEAEEKEEAEVEPEKEEAGVEKEEAEAEQKGEEEQEAAAPEPAAPEPEAEKEAEKPQEAEPEEAAPTPAEDAPAAAAAAAADESEAAAEAAPEAPPESKEEDTAAPAEASTEPPAPEADGAVEPEAAVDATPAAEASPEEPPAAETPAEAAPEPEAAKEPEPEPEPEASPTPEAADTKAAPEPAAAAEEKDADAAPTPEPSPAAVPAPAPAAAEDGDDEEGMLPAGPDTTEGGEAGKATTAAAAEDDPVFGFGDMATEPAPAADEDVPAADSQAPAPEEAADEPEAPVAVAAQKPAAPTPKAKPPPPPVRTKAEPVAPAKASKPPPPPVRGDKAKPPPPPVRGAKPAPPRSQSLPPSMPPSGPPPSGGPPSGPPPSAGPPSGPPPSAGPPSGPPPSAGPPSGPPPSAGPPSGPPPSSSAGIPSPPKSSLPSPPKKGLPPVPPLKKPPPTTSPRPRPGPPGVSPKPKPPAVVPKPKPKPPVMPRSQTGP